MTLHRLAYMLLATALFCPAMRAASPEGTWQWPDDGATIRVERSGDTSYSFVIVDSPSLELSSGTIFGTAHTTARPDIYEATFFTHLENDSILTHPRSFTIEISTDRAMSVTTYHKGKRVSLWRWIPYLFRVGVYDDKALHGIEGPVRVKPNGYSSYPVAL